MRPTLIRVEADEATYALHVILRFELELALMEGTLAVADIPAAWNDGMRDLLGVEVPDDRHGCLQDIHWAFGELGYFPTYAIGNVMSAQLWEALTDQVDGVEDALAAGDCAPVRGWLREHVHRHGRTLDPPELLRARDGQRARPGAAARATCARSTARSTGSERQCELITRSIRPYSTACSAVKKRSRSMSSWTCSMRPARVVGVELVDLRRAS